MLHKALLSSPKEFRISIGTQTYCTASVNKSRAINGTFGAMNKIPYWQERSWYLTDLSVFAYARDSEYPDRLTYSGSIRANSGLAPGSASLTFKDGVTIWISDGDAYSHSQYETLRKHEGEVATVKFSTAPDGYL